MGDENQRQNIRFNPDGNALAIIHIDGNPDNSLIGLLRDESHQGCGAVFHREHFPYEESDVVELKAHRFKPAPAKIAWIQPIDEKLIKVGFEYQ